MIFLVGSINYIIDPLWMFTHSNRFNNAQAGFDERQQKTNRAYFGGLDKYNALVLGSSRTTYISQEEFKGVTAFNYSAGSMFPNEYKGWVNVAKKIKGDDFDYIFIGFDFWTTDVKRNNNIDPGSYLAQSKSFLYRFKMLFTIDTLFKTFQSLMHYITPGTIDYTRNNIKKSITISEERKKRVITKQWAEYEINYSSRYKYNNNLRKIYANLTIDNPNTKFIVFTTPVTEELYTFLIEKGMTESYQQWLNDIVLIFGEMYNFMDINSITSNPNNFPDLHHTYPFIGTLISNRVTNENIQKVPNDFGTFLNKQNIDNYLNRIIQ